MSSTTLPVTIAQWRAAYQAGAQPASLLASLLDRLDPQDPAWICLASPQQLDEQLQALAERRTAAGDDPQALPLYGVLRPLSASKLELCTGDGDFLVAGAKSCSKPKGSVWLPGSSEK